MSFLTHIVRCAQFNYIIAKDALGGNRIGMVSTILDEAMGWASVVILKKFILTKKMTIDFLRPVFIGQEISVMGQLLNIMNEREAEVQGIIYDTNRELSAKSSSIVSLFTLEEIRKMKIFEDSLLNGIESILNTFD